VIGDREAIELRRVHSPLLSSYGPPRCRHCDEPWPCADAHPGSPTHSTHHDQAAR